MIHSHWTLPLKMTMLSTAPAKWTTIQTVFNPSWCPLILACTLRHILEIRILTHAILCSLTLTLISFWISTISRRVRIRPWTIIAITSPILVNTTLSILNVWVGVLVVWLLVLMGVLIILLLVLMRVLIICLLRTWEISPFFIFTPPPCCRKNLITHLGRKWLVTLKISVNLLF